MGEMSGNGSELVENAVYHPIYWGGTHAVTTADGLVLKVLYHLLDKRQLHILGVRHDEFLTALFVLKYNRLVGEYGEGE